MNRARFGEDRVSPRSGRARHASRLIARTARAAAWCAACASLFSSAPLRADTSLAIPTDANSNVTIKVTSPLTAVPHFGFIPVRVSIENLTTRDGVWRFRFEAGARGTFPGVATSTFELAVPSPQTREAWFYVPVIEPGLTNGGVGLAPIASSGGGWIAATPMPGPAPSLQLPSTPPFILGVFPSSPAGVAPPVVTSSDALSLTGTRVRRFTIEQKGPAAALPALARDKLPPNVTSVVSTPNAAGEVTRTTIVPVEAVASGGAVGFTSFGSAGAGVVGEAAIGKLKAANLDAGTTLTRSTSRTIGSGASAMLETTVTITQRGPAAQLPLPPNSALPAGFKSVAVNPSPVAGQVVREFVYVEQIPVPASATPPVTFASGRSMATAEADARAALAPTGLLNTPGTVRTTTRSSSSGSPAGVVQFVLFEQIGPAGDLPLPSTAGLPASVRVMVHPAPTRGQVVRTISVVDPAALAALRASSNTSDRMLFARLEIQRLGYLRNQPGVQQGNMPRSPTGGSGIAGYDYIFTESGPANLIPPVPAGVLPNGITSNITPSPIPGEFSRNFIVSFSAMSGAGGGGGGAISAAGAAMRMRAGIGGGGGTPPTPLTIDVSGPGLTVARVAFPASNNSAMPPMAVGASIEAAVRAKLVSGGLRTVPNFSAVEPAQLPADWRVWSSFNGVLLKRDDFEALDAGRRSALRSWVALGGVLFLSPSAETKGATDYLGAGRIETLDQPVGDLAASAAFATLQLGELAPGMPDRDRFQFAPGTPLGELLRFEPGEILWLTIFLVLFAILIGPVNLFWLAPATKRHRLFFTTPLISLAGAVAVAAAIVMQDGFGGDGARRALVVLVPGENQAAVFQEQATRTGFLAQRTFPLEEGVVCAVLPTDENRVPSMLLNAHFSRERMAVTGDWFRNRSRQAQLLRALVPTRARVELVGTAPGGAPIVESTLATELRDFRLRDERGNFWRAASVGPGRRVTLEVDSRFSAAAATSRETGRNGTENFSGLVSAATLRGPWQWSARGGATDLAPIQTLPGIRWQNDDVTYAGVVERNGEGRKTALAPAASTPAVASVVAGEKGGQ